MDYYLSEENCYNRLVDEFKKYGKLIFCVDYDDTIFDFHKKGRKYDCVINLLKRWGKYSEVIIFTGNSEDKYPEIEKYLTENNIKYKQLAYIKSKNLFYRRALLWLRRTSPPS